MTTEGTAPRPASWGAALEVDNTQAVCRAHTGQAPFPSPGVPGRVGGPARLCRPSGKRLMGATWEAVPCAHQPPGLVTKLQQGRAAPLSSSHNRAQRGHRACGLARSKGHRVELDRSSPTSGTALISKAVPHPHSPWVRGVQAPHPGPSGSSSSRVNGPPFPQACVSPEPTGLSRLGPQPPPAALRWLSPCAPPAGSMAAEPGTGAEGGDPERPGQGDRAGHPPAGGRHDAGPGGEREGSREPVRLSAVGPWPRGPAPRCCAPRARGPPLTLPLAR